MAVSGRRRNELSFSGGQTSPRGGFNEIFFLCYPTILVVRLLLLFRFLAGTTPLDTTFNTILHTAMWRRVFDGVVF